MSFDLNVFIEYLKDCYRVAVCAHHALRAYEEDLQTSAGPTLHALAVPRVPERIIANMQTLIEHLDDEDTEGFLITVLQRYQVQHARFQSAFQYAKENCDSVGSAPSDIDETFGDMVFLFLLIEHMFPFARGKTEKIPPFAAAEEKVYNTLHVLESDSRIADRIDHNTRKICQYVSAAAQRDFYT